MGTPASEVPASFSRTSSEASASVSSSTVSALVRATTPADTPRTSRMARCSADCGIQPSLAATTNRQTVIPPAPASMFLTKRSCPGTSTTPISRPDGSGSHANPRSIVSPRRFSSAKRSGSIPVSRLTSVDLPWSTCPAVPMTCITGTIRRGDTG
jgi:hypothetical protein